MKQKKNPTLEREDTVDHVLCLTHVIEKNVPINQKVYLECVNVKKHMKVCH